MSVCFHESRETIELLRHVVDKLDENNGCISAEELWDSVERVPANVWSPDLTVARHGMRQMEGVSGALQSFMSTLVSTYNAHISTTRHRAHIPQLTIGSLPNEIILHIVKDAFDCRKPMWLVRYSHVSTKIRNLILDSPSLWASIPLTLDIPAWLTTIIANRSAELKLTVDIDISGTRFFNTRGGLRPVRSASVLSRLSAMLEHHQRFKELTLSISGEPVALILKRFPRVNLTSVRALEVGGVGVGTDFLKKWEFAPLEKLVWRNECSLPPFSMATQALRVCSLRLQESNSNLLSIAAFLRAATGLRSLMLELEPLADSRPVELSEIGLSCLEHLNIDFSSKAGHSVILIKSILCPGLKHLTITAHTHAEYSDLTENMRERYPMLTAFTLIAESHYLEEDFFFDDILYPLPTTIKDLKIKRKYDAGLKLRASRGDNILSQNSCISLPNLTELDLEGCTILEDGFYDKLSEILSNFRVSLNHFRPGRRKRMNRAEKEREKVSAIMTLQRTGVLVASSWLIGY